MQEVLNWREICINRSEKGFFKNTKRELFEMRKVISLGLCALMFSLVSGQVFAGNVDECEKLANNIYSKGLYGLCIAYHNAGNDNARERILANYEKKAGPNDPPMPGAGVACPCWDADHLAAASLNGIPSACLNSDEGPGQTFSIDLALYNAPPAYYQFISNPDGCFRVDPDTGGTAAQYASDDERTMCVAGIQTLIEDDFDGIICDGNPQ